MGRSWTYRDGGYVAAGVEEVFSERGYRVTTEQAQREIAHLQGRQVQLVPTCWYLFVTNVVVHDFPGVLVNFSAPVRVERVTTIDGQVFRSYHNTYIRGDGRVRSIGLAMSLALRDGRGFSARTGSFVGTTDYIDFRLGTQYGSLSVLNKTPREQAISSIAREITNEFLRGSP